MKRLCALVLLVALPCAAWAQGAPPPPDTSAPPPPPLVAPPSYPEPPPPPPSYPPAPPQQQPQPNLVPNNLQPYAPLNPPPPSAVEPKSELGLDAVEFFASAAVTIGATVAVASAIGNTSTPSQQATAQIAALLYIGLIPAVSSLPVWLIGLTSNQYEPRIGPAIEAGSAVSGIAVIIYLIVDQTEAATGTSNGTSTWKYVAGGLLVVGMPLAEVLAMNLTKTPKLSGPAYGGPPILPEPPQRFAQVGLPVPNTWIFGLPSISF